MKQEHDINELVGNANSINEASLSYWEKGGMAWMIFGAGLMSVSMPHAEPIGLAFWAIGGIVFVVGRQLRW